MSSRNVQSERSVLFFTPPDQSLASKLSKILITLKSFSNGGTGLHPHTAINAAGSSGASHTAHRGIASSTTDNPQASRDLALLLMRL